MLNEKYIKLLDEHVEIEKIELRKNTIFKIFFKDSTNLIDINYKDVLYEILSYRKFNERLGITDFRKLYDFLLNLELEYVIFHFKAKIIMIK